MPDKREVIDSRDRSASPVFVDVTGRRRRRLRRAGYAAAALCGGYSIMIGISLAGGPVSPQTLLPKVGGGETKVAPSPKHRPPAEDGPAALPPLRPSLPGPSRPARTPGPAPAAPRASGSVPSAPSGAVPSPPPPDERRARPQGPTGTPATTPSQPGGDPPAARPAAPESPPESPPENGEPAAADERRDNTGAGQTGAEPQAAAATPQIAESEPTAPAAGARE
ncbi:hypothetical protein SAMN05443665_106126 [Actinomadura meyerae]|jgi:hypothetical protein|uniref:Uncharacterized protein n=1 Tax=Actinomadura meyerae TaxID=240840 RepID=A0A239P359_9ACTN|nr:hypothetical protein [Actinomadura meyerae]SNT61048.1 hypothetical protein SAMN05443665_106126 [Actinomadura meyerae]